MQIRCKQLTDFRFVPERCAAQQGLDVLDPVALAEDRLARLLKVDQLGQILSAPRPHENMLGVETAMHLPGLVQRARQLPARLQNRQPLGRRPLVPVLQQRVQIGPAIQGAGHQNRAALAVDFSVRVKHRMQRRNAQLLIQADVAKLPGKRRLAKRVMEGVRQVIALALEVIAGAFQLQAKHTAPATATGVGLIHRVELDVPQRIEVRQTVPLQQAPVGVSNENTHSRPSKKLTMWRMRFLSESFKRSRPRYCR